MTEREVVDFMFWGKVPRLFKRKKSILVMTGKQWKKAVHEMYKQLPAEQAKIALDILAVNSKLR